VIACDQQARGVLSSRDRGERSLGQARVRGTGRLVT
jgi:hypothetical protein